VVSPESVDDFFVEFKILYLVSLESETLNAEFVSLVPSVHQHLRLNLSRRSPRDSVELNNVSLYWQFFWLLLSWISNLDCNVVASNT